MKLDNPRRPRNPNGDNDNERAKPEQDALTYVTHLVDVMKQLQGTRCPFSNIAFDVIANLDEYKLPSSCKVETSIRSSATSIYVE